MGPETVDPPKVGLCPGRLERVGVGMQRLVDEERLPGMVLMVARRGGLAHLQTLGWMDVEGQVPMRQDALFRIYSMTKPLVCTALMSLYEEGRFQLFDPVSLYLPAFEKMEVMARDERGRSTRVAAERPLTVRMLMTHTSGLSYDFLDHSPVSELYRQARISADGGRSLHDMVQVVASLPLACQPDSAWHYGVGIDVAAHLIEVLTDRPLAEVLHERVLAPLGMEDTAFNVPEGKQARLATMYGQGDIASLTLEKLADAAAQHDMLPMDVEASYPLNDPGYARGGLGLYSTARDYLRFGQMLLNGGQLDGERVIGRKTLELMHTNHLPERMLPFGVAPGMPIMGYGFGLGSRVLMDVAQSEVPGSVGEFGWAGAARTYYWVDPQEELVGVLMTQLLGIEQPQKEFQALVYQALVD